jgi:hypothetical protein
LSNFFAPARCWRRSLARRTYQSFGWRRPQVGRRHAPGVLREDPIDTARIGLADGVPADVLVVPVEDVDRALVAKLHAEPHPLLVFRRHHLVAVPSDEAGAATLEDVRQHVVLVDVAHEEAAAVLGREGVREVHPRAAVGGLMVVVADGLQVLIDVVRMSPRLPLVVAALDDVPEVRDHARRRERLAVVVEVETPRVRKPVGEDLEALFGRMEPPDASVDFLALGVWRAGLPHLRSGKDPLAAVEPAVRAPDEAVQRLVAIVDAPAVQHRPGRPVRPIVAVHVRKEEEMGRGADPHAAHSHGERRKERQLLGEMLLLVEAAVVVRVHQDRDPAGRCGGVAPPVPVVQVLGHPETPALVERERDRLPYLGLRREDSDLEARCDRHPPHRLLGGGEAFLGKERQAQERDPHFVSAPFANSAHDFFTRSGFASPV